MLKGAQAVADGVKDSWQSDMRDYIGLAQEEIEITHTARSLSSVCSISTQLHGILQRRNPCLAR